MHRRANNSQQVGNAPHVCPLKASSRIKTRFHLTGKILAPRDEHQAATVSFDHPNEIDAQITG